MALIYKIVETSIVTDEALEKIINEVIGQGWCFEGIQFSMREASKRPSMAFVMFTKGTEKSGKDEDSDPE